MDGAEVRQNDRIQVVSDETENRKVNEIRVNGTAFASGQYYTVGAEDVGIEADYEEVVPVRGVALPTLLSMYVSDKRTLVPEVTPANATVQGVQWKWASSNAGVAKVSGDGVVSAVSAGTTTITVASADGNHIATCLVTVGVPSIGDATISVVPGSMIYDGTAKKPEVSVTLGGKTLVENTDYTIKYQNNKNAGTATVIVTGKGGYTGQKSAQFTITKAEQSITASDKSVAVGKTVSLDAKTSGKGKLAYGTADIAVATVSADGVVTGKMAGTARVTVTASETANYKAAMKTVTVTVTAEAIVFSDVSNETAHAEDISWLADAGISKGWDVAGGKKEFRPYANVAHADMAAFLFRLAKGWGLVGDGWRPAGTASFADVDAGVAHCDEIAWLAESGISRGWDVVGGRKEFRPYANVARADMAAFLHRLALKAGVGGTSAAGASFVDVGADTAHADDIAWLAATGMSKGWDVAGVKEFRPYSDVARADMAAFLHRLDGLR